MNTQVKNPVIGALGDLLILNPVSAASPITAIIGTLIRMLVIIGALIMVLYLIVGALNWITAEGKPDKLEHARNTVIHAIVGMIMLAATVAITSFIGAALHIPFLQTLNITIPTL